MVVGNHCQTQPVTIFLHTDLALCFHCLVSSSSHPLNPFIYTLCLSFLTFSASGFKKPELEAEKTGCTFMLCCFPAKWPWASHSLCWASFIFKNGGIGWKESILNATIPDLCNSCLLVCLEAPFMDFSASLGCRHYRWRRWKEHRKAEVHCHHRVWGKHSHCFL